MALFADRRAAGRELGKALRRHAGRPDPLVLGLPRGGVPVAYEVARALRVRVVDPRVLALFDIGPRELEEVALAEGRELARRERLDRGDRPPADVRGTAVFLVDDGLATPVGRWYADFDQTDDEEVERLLAAAGRERWWERRKNGSSVASPPRPGH